MPAAAAVVALWVGATAASGADPGLRSGVRATLFPSSGSAAADGAPTATAAGGAGPASPFRGAGVGAPPHVAAVPAAAANCKRREEIVAVLRGRYKESRRAIGLANPQQMLELFAAESGTWTALITSVGGLSCIVASGDGWQLLPPEVAGDPISFDPGRGGAAPRRLGDPL